LSPYLANDNSNVKLLLRTSSFKKRTISLTAAKKSSLRSKVSFGASQKNGIQQKKGKNLGRNGLVVGGRLELRIELEHVDDQLVALGLEFGADADLARIGPLAHAVVLGLWRGRAVLEALPDAQVVGAEHARDLLDAQLRYVRLLLLLVHVARYDGRHAGYEGFARVLARPARRPLLLASRLHVRAVAVAVLVI